MTARGWDGASAPRDAAEADGGVSIAWDVPVGECMIRWPGELPCGEPAQVVMVTCCPACHPVHAPLACATCCVEVQRLDECPVCGTDGPGFHITALPAVARD